MQTRPLSERNRQLLTAASRSAPYLRIRRSAAGRLKLPLPSRAVGRVGFEPTKIAHHIISVAPLYLAWIPANGEDPRADPLSSDFRELIRSTVTPFSTVFPLYHSRPTDWVHQSLHQVLLRWFPVIHKPLSLWIAVLPYGTSLPCELRGARFTCVPSIRALSLPDGRSLLLLDAGIEPAISA